MGKTKKIKAIHNTDCLCWKCLKKHDKDKDKIHIIEIEALGYNSRFDNLSYVMIAIMLIQNGGNWKE